MVSNRFRHCGCNSYPDETAMSEERVSLAYSLRFQFLTAGKSGQELEAASHIGSQEQRRETLHRYSPRPKPREWCRPQWADDPL